MQGASDQTAEDLDAAKKVAADLATKVDSGKSASEAATAEYNDAIK